MRRLAVLLALAVTASVNAANRETSKLIRELMIQRGLTVPPLNRAIDSICVVQICAPQP